jgi:hypothetical protein
MIQLICTRAYHAPPGLLARKLVKVLDCDRRLRPSAPGERRGKETTSDLSFLVFEPNAELRALQKVVVFCYLVDASRQGLRAAMRRGRAGAGA